MPASAVTLFQTAKSMPEGPSRGVVMTYALAYQPFSVMPIESAPQGVKKWTVDDKLTHTTTTDGFRNFDAEYTARYANSRPFSESVRIAGGRVKIDRMQDKINPAEAQRQQRNQIAAMARGTTISMFEGGDGSEFKGFDSWLDNESLFSSQTVDMGTASAGSIVTEDGLDEVLDKQNIIPGRTFIYTTQAVNRRIKKLSRGTASGSYNINYTPEQLGMFDGKYDGIPIVALRDGKGDDLLDATLGDGSSSSLYVVTYGEDNVMGFQVAPMEVIGMNEASVFSYFDIEWGVGIAPMSRQSISRLRYISNSVS